ncbi:MAG: hypothetical protein AAGK25_08640 [Pseudomonadota bacterium]
MSILYRVIIVILSYFLASCGGNAYNFYVKGEVISISRNEVVIQLSLHNKSRQAFCAPNAMLPYEGGRASGKHNLKNEKNDIVNFVGAFESFAYPQFEYIVVPPNEELKFEIYLSNYYDLPNFKKSETYIYNYEFAGVFCREFDQGFSQIELGLDHKDWRFANIIRSHNLIVLSSPDINFSHNEY